MGYGLIQISNLDPFDWNLVYVGIIGLFGNPNFMGAFSALVGIASASVILNKENETKSKILGGLLLFVSIINIQGSHALQGYVSLILGVLPIFIYIANEKRPLLSKTISAFSLVGLGVFILSLFQKGPLADLIYKQSVSYRGDFWRTAINMMKENPLFGVGFERFGVNYRLYRDLPQVLSRGVDSYSDNAHNIYFQFAATGGIFLAMTYLLFNLFVIVNFIKIIKDNNPYKYFYVSIFSIWLAIQAQTLISVDTPAIALWGWVFAGILCFQNVNKVSATSEINLGKVFGTVLVMAFSVIFLFQANAQTKMNTAFYVQLPENSPEYINAKTRLLNDAAKFDPLNSEWPILAANSLLQDKAYSQTISETNKALKLDSKDYRSWWFLATAQEESGDRVSAIVPRKEALRIDPYNIKDMLQLVRDYKAANQLENAKLMVAKIKAIAPNSAEYEQAVSEL